MDEKITVLGGGSWGTALAILLCEKGLDVSIWVRDRSQADIMASDRENKKYLPGIELPRELKVTSDLYDAVECSDVIVSAIPTQGVRGVLQEIKGKLKKDAIIVNVSKGLEVNSLLRISEVVKSELGDIPYSVLSGPSHAEEVAKGIPTTVVVSSSAKYIAEKVQDLFMTPRFRVYTNPDLVGVELGGALKNIIALGAGISDGLGYGDNTKAALMSRGFVEIAKLGVKMGATSSTFSGLSGMGDLIVTCTSMHSRNRRAGILIGEGYSRESIREKIGMAVEGIKTANATYELAQKYGVDMPITNEIYNVLYDGGKVGDSMERLMMRNKKNEMEELVDSDVVSWEDAKN